MRFNFPTLDESLEISGVTILAIEEAQVFAQIVYDLYTLNDHSSLKIFLSDQTRLTVKDIMIVTDVMAYDLNTTLLQKKILKDLEQQLNLDITKKDSFEMLLGQLEVLLDEELLEHELSLTTDELTISQFLKMVHPKMETSVTSIFEKMLELVNIYRYLQDTVKLLVFVNGGTYLTDAEFSELVHYIELAGLKVLFLESRLIPAHHQYYLDEDFYLHQL